MEKQEPNPVNAYSRLSKNEKKALIIQDKLKGLKNAELARKYGVAESTVSNALKSLIALATDKYNSNNLATYAEKRHAVLNVAEARLLVALLDEDVIAKANLRDRAYAFYSISNLRRLESGLSTSNVHVLAGIVESAHKQMHALAKKPLEEQVNVLSEDAELGETSGSSPDMHEDVEKATVSSSS